jgi:hypothetical protein
MGVQRKRRRREERLEEEEQERGREPAEEAVQEKERPQEREATAVDRVLDLQKTAGNRATTEAISRWGMPWLPLAAAPQWPKGPQVILDGVVIPLESWSWAETSAGTGAGPTGQGVAHLDDINVTTVSGDHSSDLMQKTAQGQPIKTVFIVVPGKDGKGVTIKLENVMITSYQTSGSSGGGAPVETWSLSYTKRELTQAPPPRH